MNIADVKLIVFPSFDAEDSSLTIFSATDKVPFPIKRVFTISTACHMNRGFHAHKECNQLLVCLQGKTIVTVDDGHQRKEIELTKSTEGLFVPATVWAEQSYDAQTILMVLTDQPYDEKDYIRDYQEFLKFRGVV
jgi:dTDP-4-dehydrorhamnose 3,5-epimerase-like enzyme